MHRAPAETALPTVDGSGAAPWLRDPWFLAGIALWALSFVIAVVPVFDAETRSVFSDLWADFITLPFTLGLALRNGLRARAGAEQRFWLLFAFALGCWVAVRVMYVSFPDEGWGVQHDVATDIIFGLFYLLVAVALELKPHDEPEHMAPVRARQAGVPVWTTVLFFAATVTYFVLLPSREDPEAYRFWLNSFALYVILDLYLLGRVVALSHRARGRWARTYHWLTITFLIWAVTDTLEGLTYAEVIPWVEPGSPVDAIWYLPTLVLIVAMRAGDWGGEGEGEARTIG